MKIPKYFTTVTPFSRTLSYILFVSAPFMGFFIGMNYQATLDSYIQAIRPFFEVRYAPVSTTLLPRYTISNELGPTEAAKILPLPTLSPAPTCIPRPRCLNSKPPCLIPVSSNMCSE